MASGHRSSHRLAGTSRPTLSIRARLIVLAVLAVAPLLVDRIRLLEADRNERVAAAHSEAVGLARRGVEAQQEIVIAARAVLQVVSRAHATILQSGESCSRVLTDIAADVPWIKGLSVIAPDGRIACSTFANAVGLDISDRAYFQDALRTGELVLSDYLVGRPRGAATMVAALPARGSNGSVAGVITAGVDLQWLARLASVVGERAGAAAVVVDDRGSVIARHPNSEALLGRRVPDQPLVKAMLERPSGTITAAGLDGVRRIFGYHRLPGTDAHLAVGLDENEVLGRASREMWIAFAQLAFVSAVVLFGVWFGGERLIVQPIRSLARSAARIGRGNLDARLSGKIWAAEFAPLAAALDDMARRLGAREEELHVANAHLEQLASRDGLSGLANRRGFDASLDAEWRRSMQLPRPLALLMIDVDHFKLFNDTHGHVEGDECLRTLGEVFAGIAIEGAHFAARYGGEEFALLMPGADTAAGCAVAERLRAAVEGLLIANVAAPSGHVTISIGVASLEPRPGEDAQALVEAADTALYAAKRRGRNAVVAHAPIALSQAC